MKKKPATTRSEKKRISERNGTGSPEKQSRPEIARKSVAKRGRPSAYSQEHGERIINLMAAGLSITAAAGEIGVSRRTVYEWEEKHADFSHTIKIARAKRLLFLERRLLSATDGPTVTSSIFALKNACPEEWRDKHEVEHAGPIDYVVTIGGSSV